MAATYPLLPAEARALLEAIDAGEGSALLLLADAMEEAGDRRTPGIQAAIGRIPHHRLAWGWVQRRLAGDRADVGPGEEAWEYVLCISKGSPLRDAARMAGGAAIGEYRTHGPKLASRSLAYLALAEALASEAA